MALRNTSVNIIIGQVASQNKSTINSMGYNARNNITCRGQMQVSSAPALLKNVTIRDKARNCEMSKSSKKIEQFPNNVDLYIYFLFMDIWGLVTPLPLLLKIPLSLSL